MPRPFLAILAITTLALCTVPTSIHAAETEPEARIGVIQGGLGEGVTLITPDGDLRFQVRARAQVRATFDALDGEDATLSLVARRVRLALRADAPKLKVGVYLQLGFAPGDLDPAAPNIVRDALITWTPSPAFQLRVGQTKVPFNREQTGSSSALAFVDRSVVNGELSLDRDLGLQVFLNQLDGDGHLGLQLGVFGGDGRNVANTDLGLLYTARLEYKLDPRGDTASDADLRADRSTPLFAVGLGGGYNHRARRVRSTSGGFIPGALQVDFWHGELDLIFKYEGWSISAELLVRRSGEEVGFYRAENGDEGTTGFRNGLGWFIAIGRAFNRELFAGLRYAEIRPIGDASLLGVQRIARLTGGWFIADHALKLQADYGYHFGEDLGAGRHEVRLQTQVFF